MMEVSEREAHTAATRPSSTMPPTHTQEFENEAVDAEDSSDSVGITGVDGPPTSKSEEDIVSFSIGQEQLRMKSPATPAVEKARALDQSKDYFDLEPTEGNLFEDGISPERHQIAQEATDYTLNQDGNEKAGSGRIQFPQLSPLDIPSRSILKDGFEPKSRRSSSGSPGMVNAMKKLLSDLPSLSLPKVSSLQSLGLGSKVPAENQSKRPKRSSTLFSTDNLPWVSSNPSSDRATVTAIPEPTRDSSRSSQSPIGLTGIAKDQIEPDVPRSKVLSPQAAQNRRLLRRATSDASLYLRHDLERTTTRDDAEKLADVSDQINARFKAITDSFQDSAIARFPKMPNVNISSFKPGIQRNNNGASGSGDQLDQATPIQDSGKNIPDLPPPSAPKSGRKGKHAHPILRHAMSGLTGDVVVLGGYRGSILRSAKPPHKQLWVPVKVGINLRRVDLEVGLHAEDEEKMTETIVPSGVLSHIGPVDICRRLLRYLEKSARSRSGELRVHDYGYDWRLSPHLLSRQLVQFLKSLECNRGSVQGSARGAIVIAHSLGGVITRHAVNQRPDLFAGVIYAGVPQHCINILGPLRNGDDVLLSSRVLTAQVNFTLRTSYALLPESGRCFIDKTTGERYDVDFFDVKTWQDHCLSPCVSTAGPSLPPEQRRGIIGTLSESLPPLPFANKRNTLGQKDSPPAETFEPSLVNSAKGSVNHSVNATAQKTERLLPPSPSQELEPTIDSPSSSNQKNTVATACTIPLSDAVAYLERTLRSVRQFKQELGFNIAHQAADVYPPISVLYSSSIPTVFAARVDGPEAIKRSDAFDNLAFAAGDGIVLSNSARPPEGYRVVKGGLVRSERGHIGLLGDLEAVGTCLQAIVNARKRGVGTGKFVKEN